ncbi:hypothetical protein BDEG_20120 [Batrachochytrium dendrobatidis JEL423]|uniref:Uncharacterized protein n=1 Tax=Batrachochytrium dendrobatidis (strain JEL423) TaxID=403673 RepID=A0A177W940_BATDL|nr:hypothetical protein BDEG_20120 [Batrachochytrium dendrobatidis JEL423]
MCLNHVQTSHLTLRQEVDQLVESLIGPIATITHLSVSDAKSTKNDETAKDPLSTVQPSIPANSTAPAAEALESASQFIEGMPANTNSLDTDFSDLQIDSNASKELESPILLDVAPEVVTYSKEVQTDETFSTFWETSLPESPTLSRKPSELQSLKRKNSETALRRKSSEASLVQKVSTRDLRSVSRDTAHSEFQDKPTILEETKQSLEMHIPELSEQEKAAIITSEDFLHFFDQSTRYIERALAEDYDILSDYTATVDQLPSKGVAEIQRKCVFSNEKLTKNRSVTDLDWSTHYPELLLGSYNKNSANINEPDGLVLLWNLHMAGRPEFSLQAQSDVMTAKFSPFHHNLVVGGTYSGQIVIWDTRAKSTPILKTSLSSPGHSHPVYSLSIVGTQNAHNLVTASTDGVVCTWQLDMLAHPQDLIELTHPSNSRTDEVAISCMDFSKNDFTTYWVGTEEGNIYQSNRHDRAGSKAGIDSQFVYSGHNGMITGIDFHPSETDAGFCDLFLTSSVDWTVKLWKAQTSRVGMQSSGPISCLHSFDEAQDYIFDVAWCPTHPAIFGSVDSSGRFDLYNLAISEVPIATEVVPNKKALNKLGWDKEGRHVGLASIDGSLSVYDTGKLCLAHQEDASRFHNVLKEFAIEQ